MKFASGEMVYIKSKKTLGCVINQIRQKSMVHGRDDEIRYLVKHADLESSFQSRYFDEEDLITAKVWLQQSGGRGEVHG